MVVIAEPVAELVVGDDIVAVGVEVLVELEHLHHAVVCHLNVVFVPRLEIGFVREDKVGGGPGGIDESVFVLTLRHGSRFGHPAEGLSIGVDVVIHRLHVGFRRGVVRKQHGGGFLDDRRVACPAVLFTLRAVGVVAHQIGDLGLAVHVVHLVEAVVGGGEGARLVEIVADKAGSDVVRSQLAGEVVHLDIPEAGGEEFRLKGVAAASEGVGVGRVMEGGVCIDRAVCVGELGIVHSNRAVAFSLEVHSDIARHIFPKVDHIAFLLCREGPFVGVKGVEVVLPHCLATLDDTDVV